MTIKFGEQWVYDGEYLSCKKYSYHIPKQSLLNMDWVGHMKLKRWVNIREFMVAYNYVIKEIRK